MDSQTNETPTTLSALVVLLENNIILTPIDPVTRQEAGASEIVSGDGGRDGPTQLHPGRRGAVQPCVRCSLGLGYLHHIQLQSSAPLQGDDDEPVDFLTQLLRLLPLVSAPTI